VNQHTKYLGRTSFCLTVILQNTQTHTPTDYSCLDHWSGQSDFLTINKLSINRCSYACLHI